MLLALVTAAIAVVGALLGSFISGRFQERAAERSVRVNHGETIRRDRLEAVTALACAASDRRRTMWMRGDALLKGAEAGLIQSLRRESHQTRSQVSRPLVAMRVLITDPAVRTAADHMITLTYAIRDHFGSTEELTAARETVMVAHDQFVDTAAHYLAQHA
ncbi:hypothetical protein ACF058_27775 [Streptomyces sp. NPDC015501]|uniref:hypothetical protein n=1 Tax=unclassified Streptomyces TaxID=2593676 RepID=UPI0011A10F31|nr:hypothetical protein A3L22_30130 [Streptomyces griseus subsp. griseus]